MKRRNVFLTILVLALALSLCACSCGKNKENGEEPVAEVEVPMEAPKAVQSLKTAATSLVDSVGDDLSQIKISLNLDVEAKDYSHVYFGGETLKGHAEAKIDAVLEDPTNFGSLKAAGIGSAKVNDMVAVLGEGYFAYSTADFYYKLVNFDDIDLEKALPKADELEYEEGNYDLPLPLGALVSPQMVESLEIAELIGPYLEMFEEQFAEFLKIKKKGKTVIFRLSLDNDKLASIMGKVLELFDPFEFDEDEYADKTPEEKEEARQKDYKKWQKEQDETLFQVLSMVSINQCELSVEIYDDKAIAISAKFDGKIASFGAKLSAKFSIATEGAEVNINSARIQQIKAAALLQAEKEAEIEVAGDIADQLHTSWINAEKHGEVAVTPAESTQLSSTPFEVYVNGYVFIYKGYYSSYDEYEERAIPTDPTAAGWTSYNYSDFNDREFNKVILVAKDEIFEAAYMTR